MPYDENGNYSPVVQRDANGFFNQVAEKQPTPPLYGSMTARKAGALIAKEFG